VFQWLSNLKSRRRNNGSQSQALYRKLTCESLEERTTPTASAITSSFNGTAIPAGDYIWFSSVAQVTGSGSTPVTVDVTDQTIDFTSNGTSYSIDIPNSTIVLSPSSTTASTSFGADGWSVSAPSNYSGNVFLSGLGWQVANTIGGSPVDNLLTGLGGQGIGGLAGSLNNLLGGLGGQTTSGLTSGTVNNITWTADFSSNTAGISVNWEWAAAVYKNFTPNESTLQVKTVDSGQLDAYQNSDPPGTPENFKHYVTGGAMGNGATNWTGSPTGGTTVQPEVLAPTGNAVISGQVNYYNPTMEVPQTPSTGDTVTLTSSAGSVVATTTTDANGNYSFGSLAAGTYTVSECYGGTSETVTVSASGTTTVNLDYIGD
jgi:hypothetical protein